MPKSDSSTLGIRSDRLYARIGAIKSELAKIQREMTANGMDVSALNIEYAKQWLAGAQRNWDRGNKW